LREYAAFATGRAVSLSQIRDRRRDFWRLSLSANFGISFFGNAAIAKRTSSEASRRQVEGPTVPLAHADLDRKAVAVEVCKQIQFVNPNAVR
jgi:hypothetical protein